MFGIRRIVTAGLAASLLWSCVVPARAVGDGVGVLCDEAYYATTDAYGNLTEGSVVKSYVLNGATTRAEELAGRTGTTISAARWARSPRSTTRSTPCTRTPSPSPTAT